MNESPTIEAVEFCGDVAESLEKLRYDCAGIAASPVK
jgi:hypothetical protein